MCLLKKHYLRKLNDSTTKQLIQNKHGKSKLRIRFKHWK